MKMLETFLAGVLLFVCIAAVAGQYTPIPPISVQPIAPMTPYCAASAPTVWAVSFQTAALSGVLAEAFNINASQVVAVDNYLSWPSDGDQQYMGNADVSKFHIGGWAAASGTLSGLLGGDFFHLYNCHNVATNASGIISTTDDATATSYCYGFTDAGLWTGFQAPASSVAVFNATAPISMNLITGAVTFNGGVTASGITSTSVSNSLGATVFSGAITGGNAATLGAVGTTGITSTGQIAVNAPAGSPIQAFTASGSTTGAMSMTLSNTSGGMLLGMEGSAGGQYVTGAVPYAMDIRSGNQPMSFSSDSGAHIAQTIDVTNHLFLTNANGAPTIASGACGTTNNGTISGTDQVGVITIGAVATTTCTVTFGSTWTTAPRACLFSPGNAAAAAATVLPYSTVTNTTTWVLHGAVLASTTWNYHCF